jgi:hypothetical protein
MMFIEMLQGFIPRGEKTLTSRLFILDQMKNEIDRQMAMARTINKQKLSLSTRSPLLNRFVETDDEEQESERDYEENLTVSSLLEDLINNPDGCAFPAVNQNRCLSNRQVYQLLDNHIELMKVSHKIEEQLYKPNEQMCTSIELSRATLDVSHLIRSCSFRSSLRSVFRIE